MLVEMMIFRVPVPAGWNICNCSSVLRPAWRGRSFSRDAFEGNLIRYQRWKTAHKSTNVGRRSCKSWRHLSISSRPVKNIRTSPGPCCLFVRIWKNHSGGTYFQIDIPSNFSRFLNIIVRWFPEICNLHRIHTSFQANNRCSMGHTIGEVIEKFCGIQSGWRYDNSKGRPFLHYSGWRVWAD